MAAQTGTVQRILDTAEVLFAEKGFAETSLRAITSKAGVNLAAVNYHFGSKEALIQAVFERFLTPFCTALDARMDELAEADEAPGLDRLLALVSGLALTSQAKETHRIALFFRLCGLAYTQAQGHLRRYLREQYGAVFKRFLRVLNAAAPDVPPMELFWRIHFGLGAAVFALSSMDSLRAICKSDFGVELGVADVNQRLLPFIVGGIRSGDAAS
ncbi:TetR/AcrR family transcriptional regulator [Alcanivorax quisquiliarum]|uniref:TetR family transcriptional regulator n=1 Tax=Alcanivorax quisquiliarum TaxID=2933565 RepID=A0ABT0E4G1_9GAMM|nr:TetR/AcrR family transcriptional regulator [Alcanivorax quisquiliarum]MCK0536517.1 TetR family transcriptional regulator [Alcanivorax quisquiliarum]